VPISRPTLDLAGAAAHVARRAFRPGDGRVGVELELLPVRAGGGRPGHGAVRAALEALGPLPGGSAVTFEPGGQVELSTPPAATVDGACDALAGDLAAVGAALADADLGLVATGLDPAAGPPPRVVDAPRYAAMERYFDGQGPFGRTMMCATAGLQVNLDCEAPGDGGGPPTARFGLAHLFGPTLAACFANSPLAGGRPTGWKSSRLATWWRIDPCRTGPAAAPGSGPAAWPAYALGACVMLVRTPDGGFRPLRRPLTMAGWIARGHRLGHPTLDDLDYHLTTLFPPVRPRGWLELRMVDSLPSPWWRVPVALAAALLADPAAAEAAAGTARRTAGLWTEASRSGLEHPLLAASARACFAAASESLARTGASPATRDAVAAYAERYVARGRTPADDVLDGVARHRPSPTPAPNRSRHARAPESGALA